MQQHNGSLWRALAVVLGLWVVPANAAPADASKQSTLVVDYLWAKLVEFGWSNIALLIGAAIVASFFVCWGVARLLAPQHGTFLKTLRYFLVSWVLTVLVMALAGGIGWFAIRSGAPTGALIGGVVAVVGFIVISFAVPMVIFDLGIVRTILLNILIAIGNTAVQTAGMALLPSPFPEIQGKSPEEVQQIIAEWDMKRRQKELEARMEKLARGTQGAPAESAADQVQRLYQELQQAREKLDVNDQTAVTAFNARVAEYNAAKARLVPASTAVAAPGKQ